MCEFLSYLFSILFIIGTVYAMLTVDEEVL